MMSLVDLGTEGRDIGRTGRIGVAPGHRNASPSGHKRQGAHAGTADAHEVDGSRIVGGEQIHG
jgi:hypothetical protein